MPLSSFDLLICIITALFSTADRFHTLAVYNGNTWFWISFEFNSYLFAKPSINRLSCTSFSPLIVLGGNMLPWWKIVRQHAPLATSPGHIAQGIDNLANIDRSFSPRSTLLCYIWSNTFIFLVIQVRVIRQPRHSHLLPHQQRSKVWARSGRRGIQS